MRLTSSIGCQATVPFTMYSAWCITMDFMDGL